MGSKRLKAIALRGRGEVAVADPGRVAALSAVLRERAIGPATAKYRVLGTGANLRVLQRMGQLPTRNFTGAVFQRAHVQVRRARVRRAAAAREYGSVSPFGPNGGVDDLDAVLDAIALCDAY